MKTKFLVLSIAISLIWCAAAIASDLEVVEHDKASSQTTQTGQAQAPSVNKASASHVPASKAPSQEVTGQTKSAQVSEPEAILIRADEGTSIATTIPASKLMPPPPSVAASGVGEPIRYTLGPDDVIQIIVRRHPEFSDTFSINAEGKIQCKFVGDIEIKGLSKTEVKDKITKILSKFIINPDVDVTIVAYLSKVIYVIGEVGAPGKYFMKADQISLREAVVQAGLPTLSASMRKTQLIRPDKSGKPLEKRVDLYALLYEGKLNLDLVMLPGDVLVVPATLFAKIGRIISPVSGPVFTGANAARRVQTGGF